jgi:type IV secretion system protein VirB4
MSEHVLWREFEAPSTLALWDGSYLRSYGYRGPDTSSASKAERVQLDERLSSAVQLLGSRWCWHIEGQNCAVRGYPKTKWPTSASALLDAERRQRCLEAGTQFELKTYLTLTESHPSYGTMALAQLVQAGDSQSSRMRQRDSFRKSCDELAHVLRGLVKIEDLDDDDIATYLHSTISTQRHRIRASDHQFLNETLPDERFSRGIGLSRLGRSYMTVMSLGGYPKMSSPQLLSALARLPFEFRWVTRWLPMSRMEAKRLMSARQLSALGNTEFAKDHIMNAIDKLTGGDKKNKPKRLDRDAVKRADMAGDAMEQLSERGYGSMTTVFVVTEKDRRRCLENTQRLKTELQGQELVVREETIDPVVPWRMSFPGNRETSRRTFPVSTRNLADLMPTSSIWQGMECDRRLETTTGVRRPWMYTSDPTPMRINSDVPGGGAHVQVFGAVGSAKSTLINHLAMQFQGWPRAQVVSLSVGLSEFGPAILSGGAVYSIGKPDSQPFQPLAFVDEHAEAVMALEWLQGCVESLDEAVTPSRTEKLGEAVRLIAGDDPRRRTMTELVKVLKSSAPDLALILKPFTRAGFYGHIFDGDDVSALDRKRWTMFDVGALLNGRPAIIRPAIAHLMQRIRRWIDGSPTLVYMDEVPDWLHKSPQLERDVVKFIDTDRKNEVRVLMAAQMPSQLDQFKLLQPSVKSGCATKIYGPDANAKTQMQSYLGMGVTETEVDAITRLPLGSYLLKNQHGSRAFALNPGPIALALTGMSRPDELALLAELHSRCSDADQVTDELLKAKGLQEAARKLGWRTRTSGEEEAKVVAGMQPSLAAI